ncbi:MAG: hypothetical protein DCC55_05510 [Chloroflexi bacterium]|nr:MAG: hypothetical protein DCC55_05510 [Chloroflexota bacterium]
MPDRFDLIARKQEVRRLIEQVQRQLEAERAKKPAPDRRRLNQLERRLEQLMAEEYNLRVAIDQTRR